MMSDECRAKAHIADAAAEGQPPGGIQDHLRANAAEWLKLAGMSTRNWPYSKC